MRIAVVSDSTGSLDPADAAREGITVVPLHVIIGADVFADGTVPSEQIAQALADFVPVNTSRPSPEDFLAAYESLAADGAEAIVSVHLSAKMSGTIESAQLAAKQASVPVTVVDTRQVGLATGFAAGRAARVAAAGGSVEEAAAAAREAGESSQGFFYVDTLEYLRRGGRVGAAAALIGSALSVKPLLTITDGAVVPLERVRTTSKALSRLEALAVDAAQACDSGYDVGVQHLASPTVAEGVAARLAATLGRESVPVDELGPVIGAHVGPGTVAVTITPR